MKRGGRKKRPPSSRFMQISLTFHTRSGTLASNASTALFSMFLIPQGTK